MSKQEIAHRGTSRTMLNRQYIKHVYTESGGGYIWINWRRYLADFLPRLF